MLSCLHRLGVLVVGAKTMDRHLCGNLSDPKFIVTIDDVNNKKKAHLEISPNVYMPYFSPMALKFKCLSVLTVLVPVIVYRTYYYAIRFVRDIIGLAFDFPVQDIVPWTVSLIAKVGSTCFEITKVYFFCVGIFAAGLSSIVWSPYESYALIATLASRLNDIPEKSVETCFSESPLGISSDSLSKISGKDIVVGTLTAAWAKPFFSILGLLQFTPVRVTGRCVKENLKSPKVVERELRRGQGCSPGSSTSSSCA